MDIVDYGLIAVMMLLGAIGGYAIAAQFAGWWLVILICLLGIAVIAAAMLSSTDT